MNALREWRIFDRIEGEERAMVWLKKDGRKKMRQI